MSTLSTRLPVHCHHRKQKACSRKKGRFIMNAEQIRLVQDSFEQVKPIADQAAEIFYTRLFEVAPHTRHMFKGDMKNQGAMLMSTLGLAVGSLNDLDKIIPAVRALGRRHAGYGVQFEHFAIVGDTFLWTLEQA